MSFLLIKGGIMVCPKSDMEEKGDILIENGIIVKIRKEIDADSIDNCRVINVSDKIVAPGFIDMNTYLREPGREDIGTIQSGSESAAAGGFTSIACMPLAKPVIDSQLGVEYILSRANKTALVNVLPIGALTRGLLGEELSDMYSLVKSGVVAMSDFPLMNTQLMREALEYRNMFDIPIISFCEDKYLAKDGCINEGEASTLLGFKGVPSVAEELMVQRDIMLARFTGSRLHIATVSSGGSVDFIRRAKKDSVDISCEVSANHLCFTDRDIISSSYDTNLKLFPPLRRDLDRLAIIQGLKDATIDIIASAHSPWLENEKDTEFISAAVGVIGLETMIPIIFTELIETGILSLKEALAKITINPASRLNLSDRGVLEEGKRADIVVVDPDMEFEITRDFFHSVSKNSPFIGRRLKGFAIYTIVDGQVVYDRKKDVFRKREFFV